MHILTLNDLAAASDGDRLAARTQIASLTTSYFDMLAEEESPERARPPGVHASELKCIKQVVYNLNDQPQVKDANSKWRLRFKMGHLIHDLMQNEFAKLAHRSGYKITFLKEAPIKPSFNELARHWEIHSSCDGIFTFHHHSGALGQYLRIGLEIKSISPTDYDALKGPSEDHLNQIHLYMACLDLAYVWVLYFNKGNQEFTKSDMKQFVVEFDPRRWATVESRIASAHQHAAAGTLPEREEGFHCQFCPFSKDCKPPSLQVPEVDRPTQILTLGKKPPSSKRR